MPLARAVARAGGSDFCGALRLLLPRAAKRIPQDLTGLYGFVADQDLLAGPPPAALTPRDLSALRGALKGAPAKTRAQLLATGDILAGRPAAAVKRLDGARHDYLRAAALWLVADKTRSRAPLAAALKAARRAVKQLGPRRDVLLLRGQILLELERNDAGLADLRRVLRADPKDWRTRLGVAETLTDMYRYRPALAELARVERARGRPWWLLAQRARLKGFCGKPQLALADFDAALAKERRGSLLAWRAEVLRALGRLEEARADLDEAARLDPVYAFTFELRGRLRLIAGDAAGARADLDRACRLGPSHTMAFAWRGEALWKLGRAREALADFTRVAPLDPGSLWNPGTGRVESRADREATFHAELAAGVRARPGDPWTRLVRGFLLLEKGRPAEALEDLVVAAATTDAAARERALALRKTALSRLGAA